MKKQKSILVLNSCDCKSLKEAGVQLNFKLVAILFRFSIGNKKLNHTGHRYDSCYTIPVVMKVTTVYIVSLTSPGSVTFFMTGSYLADGLLRLGSQK